MTKQADGVVCRNAAFDIEGQRQLIWLAPCCIIFACNGLFFHTYILHKTREVSCFAGYFLQKNCRTFYLRATAPPIIPSAWKLNVSKSAAKQFAVIKKLVKEADEIINGGDPDREGQLLVDEVLEYLKNKKRSWGCRMKEKSSWSAPSFSSLINFDYHTYNFMQKLNAKRAHEYNRLFVRYMHASLLFAR